MYTHTDMLMAGAALVSMIVTMFIMKTSMLARHEQEHRERMALLHTETERLKRRDECCWHQKGCPGAFGDRKLTPSQLVIVDNLRWHKMLAENNKAGSRFTKEDRETLEMYEQVLLHSGQRVGSDIGASSHAEDVALSTK